MRWAEDDEESGEESEEGGTRRAKKVENVIPWRAADKQTRACGAAAG